MDLKTILFVLFLGVGGLLAALSVPLILGKVPPNPWYGFRTPRTLSDARVWYPANRYAAWRMLLLAGALAATATVGYLATDLGLVPYALTCAAVVLVGVVLSVALTVRHFRTLS